MKFFITFSIFAFLVVTLAGCTATFQPSGDCVTGESVILTTSGGNPTGLDRALLMLNFAGLESELYPKDEVSKFLDDAEKLVDRGVSYSDLTSYLSDNVEKIKQYAGLSAVILGADITVIDQVGGAKKLSSCDTSLVKAHIQNQRNLLAFF